MIKILVLIKMMLSQNLESRVVKQQNTTIITFKFQYSDEVSNETYLGLTVADFTKSPFARYAASQKDKMTNKHQQFMAHMKSTFLIF